MLIISSNVFVLGKPFHLSLMFVKVRAYPSEAPKVGFWPTNIALSLNGLPGTNALAYYKHS
jgi:hypothetical protein